MFLAKEHLIKPIVYADSDADTDIASVASSSDGHVACDGALIRIGPYAYRIPIWHELFLPLTLMSFGSYVHIRHLHGKSIWAKPLTTTQSRHSIAVVAKQSLASLGLVMRS